MFLVSHFKAEVPELRDLSDLLKVINLMTQRQNELDSEFSHFIYVTFPHYSVFSPLNTKNTGI